MFEWDRAKAQANEAKHGITFVDAALALWEARYEVRRRDTRRDYGEVRYQALVADPDVPDLIYMIVYTPRDGRVRIISARRATQKEREHYERAIA